MKDQKEFIFSPLANYSITFVLDLRNKSININIKKFFSKKRTMLCYKTKTSQKTYNCMSNSNWQPLVRDIFIWIPKRVIEFKDLNA